jgi:putative tricarboxylic transport membrane protein
MSDMAAKDRIASIVLLLFCAFFYYETFSIKKSDLAGLSAAFFPRLLLGLLALLAILMLIRSFLPSQKKVLKAADEKEPESTKGRGWLVWAVFALFALYIFSLDLLGFILSSFLFMVIIYLLITKGSQRSAKSNVMAIGGLLATAVALFFIFEQMLNVFLPRGIFF